MVTCGELAVTAHTQLDQHNDQLDQLNFLFYSRVILFSPPPTPYWTQINSARVALMLNIFL